MESHAPKKGGAEENRKRKKNLVIRFNDAERAMLDDVAAKMSMTVSDAVRYLVRREHEKRSKRS